MSKRIKKKKISLALFIFLNFLVDNYSKKKKKIILMIKMLLTVYIFLLFF